ncbi:YceI family protein [Vulgatibacter sp.]|uniref:YceI family protein n=1 Tax=Vulgatibacter sp. TaxID=1971226 RepID=UPI003563CCDB
MAKETWQIDTTHTTIGFTVRHMVVAKVHGRFTRFAGSVELGADGGPLSAEAVIEAASIDTQVGARDDHLRSADFFDAASHPELRFRSSAIEKAGSDRYRIAGTLAIRGVERDVVLEAEYLGRMKDPFGTDRIAFSAHTSIDRRDFGLTWNKAVEAGGVLVGDRIEIALEVQAVQAAAADAA